MSAARPRLRLAFYGDDLTGSTDSLQTIVLAGFKAVLFLEPPAPRDLERYPGIEAVGVAGLSRSMPASAMPGTLRPAFAALRRLRPRHVHYKVCSTFDSTPRVGSIGRAIDIGAEVFRPRFIPLVGGAPGLGRYCLFGNLFARVGIGTSGEIHRLDRLAAMAQHAVTPVEESDIRRHLGTQTRRRIGLLDVLALAGPRSGSEAALRGLIRGGSEVVLFDALTEADLLRVGELIDACAGSGAPLFSVGPSSVEAALGLAWREPGRRRPPRIPAPADGPVLVASGSCSPVTEAQIKFALEHGFAHAAMDPAGALADGPPAPDPAAVAAAVRRLKAGRSVIIHTSRGAGDPRLASARRSALRRGISPERFGPRLAAALGRTVRAVLERAPVRRLVVAGGDTSSLVARQLGIESLEMMAAVTPGGPLCRARAPGSPLDGCGVVFKGGQVGGRDYFGRFDPATAAKLDYE